jgi:hypothetical protein
MQRHPILRAFCLVLALLFICNFLLGWCSHTAFSKDIEQPKTITLDEQGIAQLRLFKKQIAQLQYSEFCATVHKPPDELMALGKSLEEAAKAGDVGAAHVLNWLGPIVEKYQKVGCGDA